MGVHPASGKPKERVLPSGIALLDEFLGGGLPLGAVTEWGVPLGKSGREVVLTWLARATQGGAGESPTWALWVYARAQLIVYPPGWAARGVELERMRFVCTGAPLADLKPVFLEPLFKIVVLDAPRQFTDDDCAFVARQARANGQAVLVLRDTFLKSGQGNVWARLRVNCWRDDEARQFRLNIVRGLSPRQLALPDETLAARQ